MDGLRPRAAGGFISRLILFLLRERAVRPAGRRRHPAGRRRAGPGGPGQRRRVRVAAGRAGDPAAARAVPHPGRRRLADRHASTTRTGSRSRSPTSPRSCARRSSRSRTRGSTTTAASTSAARCARFVNNQSGEDVQGGSTLTQQYVKQVLLESADEHQGREGARRGAEGRDRAVVHPQAARAALRGRPRGEVHQGADPRALPQHRLLRRRRVRRRGGGQALLQHPRPRPDAGRRPRCSPASCSSPPRSTRPATRSARSPGATSCWTGWPRSAWPPAGRWPRRSATELALNPAKRFAAERLQRLEGRVLLRLRAQDDPQRQGVRRRARGPHRAAAARRAHHHDDAGPRRRRRTRRSRWPTT